MMIRFYSDISPFPDRYRPMFLQLLTLPEDSALVFHCSAGKDRTGIATALLLYALGVDEKVIMDDYLASNYYRRQENERSAGFMAKAMGLDTATARTMLSVKAVYLESTFSAIRASYGSIDNYLEKALGLTADRLQAIRAKYLKSAP